MRRETARENGKAEDERDAAAEHLKGPDADDSGTPDVMGWRTAELRGLMRARAAKRHSRAR